MGILSNLSGKEAVKIFNKFGYVVDHRTGSHMILYHDSRPTLSIPDHKELAPGLLRGLIRKSGISVDDFFKSKESEACKRETVRQRDGGTERKESEACKKK